MHGSHSHTHGHHGHGHHHDHDDHQGHSHAPADYGRAFAIGIVLNFGFVLVEVTYGVLSGSMALVADAGHNLSDVLGLLMAWGATILSGRSPSERFTYGFKSSSILAALFNASLLLVAIGAIAVEAIQRLVTPAAVDGHTVIIVAAIGIVINTATAATWTYPDILSAFLKLSLENYFTPTHILASPSDAAALLRMSEFNDTALFDLAKTGNFPTPLGMKLVPMTDHPADKITLMDAGFAVQKLTEQDLLIENDKLIQQQW